MAKLSCILCQQGVQLVLAYSWARLAILVAGKSRGGRGGGKMFLFLLFTIIPIPLSSLSFAFISSALLSLFSLYLGEDTKWPTRVEVSLNPKTVNQFSLSVGENTN